MKTQTVKFLVKSVRSGKANTTVEVDGKNHAVSVVFETTIEGNHKSVKITGATWSGRPLVDLAACDITGELEIAIENELN